jgi:hypothetical protein
MSKLLAESKFASFAKKVNYHVINIKINTSSTDPPRARLLAQGLAGGFALSSFRFFNPLVATFVERSDRFAVALESNAVGQFVRDELIVGRSLKGQEGLQERLHFDRPELEVVATGEFDGKSIGMLQSGRTQPKEMRPTNV